MLDISARGGIYIRHFERLRSIWPWFAYALSAILVAQMVATPSYAWWFSSSQTTSPTVNRQTLILTPIASAWVPHFLLHPLDLPEQPTASKNESQPIAASKPQPTTAASLTFVALPTPTPTPVDPFSARAKRMLQLVNQQRAAYGLAALQLNITLTNSAQAYAKTMSRSGHFSHTGPDGSSFVQRNVAAGYTGWSWLEENIAYGQTSVAMAMSDWMESPEHRDNILNPHVRDLGVGIAGSSPIYWVQEFGVR